MATTLWESRSTTESASGNAVPVTDSVMLIKGCRTCPAYMACRTSAADHTRSTITETVATNQLAMHFLRSWCKTRDVSKMKQRRSDRGTPPFPTLIDVYGSFRTRGQPPTDRRD